MIKITEDLLKSVEEFKSNLEAFREGKIENFKSFTPWMGIYKEGSKDSYMVRPRIPGGVVTLEQLKTISEIAKKYAEGKVRFTTRQDFQLHSIKLENLGNVLEELVKGGLTTRGAGGDGVRNVACSPLSGVAQDEVFDVTPYMKEVTNYMMIDPANIRLPRKYKVSFSNSPEDTVNATISDLGFIAKIVDGKKGFEVYGGGGLGGGARISLKLEDFIEDSEALYYVQAMKQVFEREGDRTNRHKARLRFVVQRLGEEGFVELFKNELNKLKAEKDLKLNIVSAEESTQGALESDKLQLDKQYKNIVFSQKQQGRYSLYIHSQNGSMSTETLDKLINFFASLDYEVSVRLAMTQGCFVRGLKEKDLKNLIEITSSFTSVFNLFNSITCAGPTICNFGINDSQSLLKSIVGEFESTSVEVKDALPRMFISGCPNSCGQHQRGLIGFTGKKKRTDSGTVPVYTVSFNGRVGSNSARFGEVYGDIPAKKIPKFLLELANLKVSSGYTDFVSFIENKGLEVKELVTKHSSLESFSENPELYSDFGA